jgi:hypothetical protein
MMFTAVFRSLELFVRKALMNANMARDHTGPEGKAPETGSAVVDWAEP